ncbi:DNA-directed RNA polymerase II core subunit rpb9 [Ceratobasidium sp. 428]|nr:DNA-directed RNA polymerase II core subunit rpb9 [Ceratobasidium sp. 428]KAG8771270.1 DNA-directed RNA polymerase II core subunit rpb9 [Ceratobasidium sp. 428]
MPPKNIPAPLPPKLQFCQECNNLLYPKTDSQRQLLSYACRICVGHEEESQNECVYRNDLLTVTKEQAGVTQDLHTDPTLAHSTMQCPNCNHNDSVYYQDQSKRTETRMTLFYVCTNCGHNFIDPKLAAKLTNVEGLGDD